MVAVLVLHASRAMRVVETGCPTGCSGSTICEAHIWLSCGRKRVLGTHDIRKLASEAYVALSYLSHALAVCMSWLPGLMSFSLSFFCCCPDRLADLVAFGPRYNRTLSILARLVTLAGGFCVLRLGFKVSFLHVEVLARPRCVILIRPSVATSIDITFECLLPVKIWVACFLFGATVTKMAS